jgi:asparagine synthase (glutamine-hydrolysing)
MPFDRKLRAGRSKALLKEIFADLLPEQSLRARKKGFNFPLAVWMRDHFDAYFDESMSRDEVNRAGIFNWDCIQSLREQHRSGTRDNSYPLYSLIMFDVWYRKYILNTP